MKIYDVFAPEFTEFGRVVNDIDTKPLLNVLNQRECPDDVLYVPSDTQMEALPIAKEIQEKCYGHLPIQIGFTNGHNKKLNALEYHRDSEFNVANTDIILLLGRRQDLNTDFTLDTSKVTAFKVPKGVFVEIYATTLHYAPCASEGGYRCIVVLPRGTNLDLPNKPKVLNQFDEAKLMTATNKWLIGHAEGNLPKEYFIGLTGQNLEV